MSEEGAGAWAAEGCGEMCLPEASWPGLVLTDKVELTMAPWSLASAPTPTAGAWKRHRGPLHVWAPVGWGASHGPGLSEKMPEEALGCWSGAQSPLSSWPGPAPCSVQLRPQDPRLNRGCGSTLNSLISEAS